MGDRVEPPAIHLAELDQPAVVGAGVGGGQRGVRHVAFPADPDGGIEQHTVDALAVHHGKPGVRVVAARRAALRVGDLTAGEEPRGVHLDAAQRAELPAQCLQRSAVDDQHLVALVVVADPDGAVSVHRDRCSGARCRPAPARGHPHPPRVPSPRPSWAAPFPGASRDHGTIPGAIGRRGRARPNAGRGGRHGPSVSVLVHAASRGRPHAQEPHLLERARGGDGRGWQARLPAARLPRGQGPGRRRPHDHRRLHQRPPVLAGLGVEHGRQPRRLDRPRLSRHRRRGPPARLPDHESAHAPGTAGTVRRRELARAAGAVPDPGEGSPGSAARDGAGADRDGGPGVRRRRAALP